ncbi:hypothetical protein [Rhodobacter maris]|uniref:Uncharacterized protein n=1 Tax=Rhodobacter maris TaxID=446682 RepID=A0A285TB40_9RHOB|nr:hypothetical protein [Rhodobacter maris]SOC18462.1 hypothetical protein SAMN05877831_11670 [Rhodobacter maris]
MTPVSFFSQAVPMLAPELAEHEPFGLTDLMAALCKGLVAPPLSCAGLEAMIDRVEMRG